MNIHYLYQTDNTEKLYSMKKNFLKNLKKVQLHRKWIPRGILVIPNEYSTQVW